MVKTVSERFVKKIAVVYMARPGCFLFAHMESQQNRRKGRLGELTWLDA